MYMNLNAYSIDIRTSNYPSGVFSEIATWIERKKKAWIAKKNLYSCHEEVYSKFLIQYSLWIVIVVSQIDLKICMVLTLNGTVFQVTRNVCWGKVVYHIQSIKKIDSNRLEKGAWLKQSKIDIKSPCRWSRLPFFSSLLFFYPLLQLRKPARHNFDKDNHQATSTRIKRDTMP